MAVDNPYTGGVSSLGDLARHRSLARNMRIAAKEAADSRRQAYNVNSASEPMWETQARLRDRMMWESAKHLKGKDGGKLSKRDLDDELTVVRDQATTLQDIADEAHLAHERSHYRLPFGGIYEPSRVLDGKTLYTVAQNAMARLFYDTGNRKSSPSEMKTVAVDKPASKPDTGKKSSKSNQEPAALPPLGGKELDSLVAKPEAKKKPAEAPAEPIPPALWTDHLLRGWMGKGLTQGDIDVDLSQLFKAGYSPADQEWYLKSYKDPKSRGKSLESHILLSGKYDPENSAPQIYKLHVDGTTYDRKANGVILKLRAGNRTWSVFREFNPNTMVWQADGSVKIYPSAQALRDAQSTEKAAADVATVLNS